MCDDGHEIYSSVFSSDAASSFFSSAAASSFFSSAGASSFFSSSAGFSEAAGARLAFVFCAFSKATLNSFASERSQYVVASRQLLHSLSAFAKRIASVSDVGGDSE